MSHNHKQRRGARLYGQQARDGAHAALAAARVPERDARARLRRAAVRVHQRAAAGRAAAAEAAQVRPGAAAAHGRQQQLPGALARARGCAAGRVAGDGVACRGRRVAWRVQDSRLSYWDVILLGMRSTMHIRTHEESGVCHA